MEAQVIKTDKLSVIKVFKSPFFFQQEKAGKLGAFMSDFISIYIL